MAGVETDGLVVFIVLPIREVMLGLILFLLFKLFLSEVEELFTRCLIELRLLELLRLDAVLLLREEFPGVIELPIREVMLELIRPFELLRRDEFVSLRPGVLEFDVVDRLVIELLVVFLLGDRLIIDLLVTLLLGARLIIDLLVTLLLGERLVIDLLVTLLLGALLIIDLLVTLLLGVRLVIDLLVTLLLGERLVIDLLVTLLLGVRFVIDLLVMLLLGARLVIDRLDELLLEILLLGVLLIVGRLELRLEEILLDLLEELALGAALGAGAGLETLWLERFDLLELRAERDDFAAKTGSQNNKTAINTQKTRKSELPRMNFVCLICDL